jgi:hypothetical protein
MDAEVFYGVGGVYEFEDFELVINSPRIVFDVQESESRTFVIDAVLRNKSVEDGLLNRLSASIVKDGNVIVPGAALSVTESRRVYPGEQLTFEARISLIEGTDVKKIFFEPTETSSQVDHELRPAAE